MTEASGLGVKLTVATLSPTEGITWHTELLVRDHVTFSDCSTAIVSLVFYIPLLNRWGTRIVPLNPKSDKNLQKFTKIHVSFQ